MTDYEDQSFTEEELVEKTKRSPKRKSEISEEQVRAAFDKLAPALHRTVLGRTSGAIRAVERLLPEFTKLINEEKSQ